MIGLGLVVEHFYPSAQHVCELSIPLSLHLLVTPVHALHVFHVNIRFVLSLFDIFAMRIAQYYDLFKTPFYEHPCSCPL